VSEGARPEDALKERGGAKHEAATGRGRKRGRGRLWGDGVEVRSVIFKKAPRPGGAGQKTWSRNRKGSFCGEVEEGKWTGGERN